LTWLIVFVRIVLQIDTARIWPYRFFYMQLHLLSFLLDVLSWIFIAVLISNVVLGLKKRSKKHKPRIRFTVITASLMGGLLAELTMGSRGIGLSLTNLFVAIFAAVLAISLAFPTYASLLKTRMMSATVESLKTIRLNLQSIRKS
jgi:hypothetical protein